VDSFDKRLISTVSIGLLDMKSLSAEMPGRPHELCRGETAGIADGARGGAQNNLS
jgi:hypothetical protein